MVSAHAADGENCGVGDLAGEWTLLQRPRRCRSHAYPRWHAVIGIVVVTGLMLARTDLAADVSGKFACSALA
jgi:hypothetical protein